MKIIVEWKIFWSMCSRRVLRLKISLKNNIDEINELNTEIERFNLKKIHYYQKKNKIKNS